MKRFRILCPTFPFLARSLPAAETGDRPSIVILEADDPGMVKSEMLKIKEVKRH